MNVIILLFNLKYSKYIEKILHYHLKVGEWEDVFLQLDLPDRMLK